MGLMQVQGPVIYPSSASATLQARERTAQILPFSPQAEQTQDAVQPLGVASSADGREASGILVQPVRLHADNLHARQALAAYQTVDQLEKRAYLESLLGVDDYA